MQIVIIGAGYAGLRAAIDLDRLLRQRGLQDRVTLVDQFPYHQLVQVIHHTATASGPEHKATYDLESLLRGSAVHFVQGRVSAVAPQEQLVRLQDGQALSYDRLVLALGAVPTYSIPGAREHALPLRSYEDALRLREHLITQFNTAAQRNDPKEQRILLTTAILGGGYTGCQFAGELATWVDSLCRETGAPRAEVRIALLEHSNLLLKQFGAWATRNAESVLDSLGVSVYLNTHVESIEPRLLHVSDGRVLRAATIIWAGGLKAPDLLREAGLAVDAGGHVQTDRYLRVRDQLLIFAVGDCAAIPGVAAGTIVPTTASYAMRQGAHLAEILLAEIEGRSPRMYEPLQLGALVSLGPDYALGDPLGVPTTGYPAVLLKKGVEAWYRSTLVE